MQMDLDLEIHLHQVRADALGNQNIKTFVQVVVKIF